MLRRIFSALASGKQKRFVRRQINSIRQAWIAAFLSYGPEELKAALERLGIAPTDTLLVHANFKADSGFRGTPHDLVSVFVDFVGKEGNLLMVSQPFRGFAYDYLARNKPFNVARTVSMMGLVTEMFRRREGTLRSLHPTHPVLAYGRDSAELVEGHENCVYPCGAGTPFEKLRRRGGKILFFDVSSGANTFFHHVEDLLKDDLPFPIYDPRLFSATVIDGSGRQRTVETYAFAKGVVRHTDLLESELASRGRLVRGRVGNSSMILVNANDVVDVMQDMVKSGAGLIEPPGH